MCGAPRLFVNNKPHGTYDQLHGSDLYRTGKRWSTEDGLFCDGVYIYVAIPTTNPFCLKDHYDRAIDVRVTKDRKVKHDALARGRNVCFAGTVEFFRGELIRWCNGSGHYLPDANCADQAPKKFPMNKFGWVVNDHKYGAFWTWEGKIWYRRFTSDDAYDWTEATDDHLKDYGIRTGRF